VGGETVADLIAELNRVSELKIKTDAETITTVPTPPVRAAAIAATLGIKFVSKQDIPTKRRSSKTA
jgi:TolB-like protein